jgi:hypothetical protein
VLFARFTGIIFFTYLLKPLVLHTFLNQITMPETRASNKWAHPGKPITPKPHRSKDEIEAERTAKAQANADHGEAEIWSIIRAAEFEHADRADKDFVNATPHLPFTPKPWPPLCNKNKANFTPVADISDVEISDDIEMSDDVDNTLFVSPCSKKSVSEDNLAVENDNPPPPVKRSKAQMAGKATAKVGIKTTRKVEKKTKADKDGEEIMPASDEE